MYSIDLGLTKDGVPRGSIKEGDFVVVEIGEDFPENPFTIINQDPNKAIYFAVKGQETDSSIRIIKRLIKENKASPDGYADDKGFAALHIAILESKVLIVNYLAKDTDADLNKKSQDGKTPILLAAEKGSQGRPSALALILGAQKRKEKIDLSVKNSDGDTVLHLLVKNPDMTFVIGELFKNKEIIYGIDLDAKNINGKTPYDLAKDHSNAEAIKLLDANGNLPKPTVSESSYNRLFANFANLLK